jgi:hypothetical protein
MELSGSSYLLTLASISITFGGFAALVAVVRHGRLSDYDLFFIRNTLLRSFMVAGCSLLPSLLALYEMSPSSNWRICSLITSLLLVLFILRTYVRRRAVTRIGLTEWSLVNALLEALTAIFLLVVAHGVLLKPAAGYYSAAVTTIMITAIMGFMAHLQLARQEDDR